MVFLVPGRVETVSNSQPSLLYSSTPKSSTTRAPPRLAQDIGPKSSSQPQSCLKVALVAYPRSQVSEAQGLQRRSARRSAARAPDGAHRCPSVPRCFEMRRDREMSFRRSQLLFTVHRTWEPGTVRSKSFSWSASVKSTSSRASMAFISRWTSTSGSSRVIWPSVCSFLSHEWIHLHFSPTLNASPETALESLRSKAFQVTWPYDAT